MGVETGLLQRMGLRIDPTLRQTVQSQVINLLLVKETGTIYHNKQAPMTEISHNANTLFTYRKICYEEKRKGRMILFISEKTCFTTY